MPPYLCQEVPVSADDGTPLPATGVPAANATDNKNYILFTTHRGSRPDWQSVAYFDGLGRNIQSIEVAASPKGASMVSPTVYDEFGRVPRQYMPIGMGGNGAYQNGAEGAFGGFYHAGNFPYFNGADMGVPYGDTDFEASPLNRVLEQGAPGVDWQLGNHSVKTEYQSGSFAPGIGPAHTELSIIKTIDENGNYSLSAVDKLGRAIYQENELEEGPVRTVYAYDDFGNVTHVIQPEANNTNNPLYTFTYSYDHRQRVIAKHIPGQEGETEITYDDLDRVIATKDPNGTILVTRYDAFSRPIITGYGDMQGNLSGQPLTRTFYDEYGDEAHPFAGGIPLPAFGSRALVMPTPFSTQKFKGKVTTVLVKVLPAGAYLKTTTYYDDYGREIQATADNHLGGKDISTNVFNFAGELLANVLIHEGPDGTVTIKKTFDYDHRSRLLRIIQQVDDTDPEIIGTYAYDELGQQTAKRLHATSCSDNLQTVDYTYNIRGWMTGINNIQIAGDFELDLECNTGEPQDLFGMKLLYNDDFLGGQALYNGNIAGMQWQNASNCFDKKAYGFSYDKLNRIKTANYGETTTGSLSYSLVANKYNLSLDYDKNGNISTLQRYGLIGSELFGIMDDLSYTYSGNRLTNIKDVGPSSPVVLDGIEWADQFLGGGGNLSYDANGNITADHRRTDISYNHLNKPTSVSVSGGSINWTYAADGSKLKEMVSGGTQPITRDYIGGFIYENNQLQYFAHEEGRTVKLDGDWQYQYNLTDHLGNVRVAFADANEDGIIDPLNHEELLQENHYYPFGLRMGGILNGNEEGIAEAVPEQRMRYNGKELHTELGLGWVDYGARMYEPSMGRWNGGDPVSKDYESGYASMANNPIWLIDPMGLDTFKVDYSGTITQFSGGENEIYYYTNKDGNEHSLGSFTKNENGYIQLSNFSYNKNGLSFGYSVKSGNEDEAFISPVALGSLMGSLAENEINDLVITRSSAEDGTSPGSSKSHVLGTALDTRYLRKDKSGKDVNIWSSQIDVNRNEAFINSMKKFGHTNFLSEHFSAVISNKSPLSSLRLHKIAGTKHYTKARHYHHLHIGGKWGGVLTFKPNLNAVDNRPKKK